MPAEKCVCCDVTLKDKISFHALSSIIIYKENFDQVTLKHCIEQITGIATTDLKLSDKICEICEKELVISYKFRTKVLRTRKCATEVVSRKKTTTLRKGTSNEPQGTFQILKAEDVVCEEVSQMEQEHDYGHQVIKEDEQHEEYFEIIATAHTIDAEFDEFKVDDYIEEEYLEEDVPEVSTPVQKERLSVIQTDPETPVDASQPKLNAELAKILKTRPRKHNSTFDCTICNYKSKHSRKDLKVHMLRVHFPDEMYIFCNICRKRCATTSELKSHSEKYHGDSKNAKAICAICGEGFSTGTKLHAHMLEEHAAGDRIPCDLCDATFKSMTNLKMHKKLHNETNEVHECPVCTKTFRISYYLTKHIKDAHSSNPKIFVCNECGQTAKSKKDIRLHLTRRHFPECKSHLCVDCGKMFETSHRLSDHIRSWHNRELRYECDICHRKFIHPASLRIHKSTHSTVCPFSCDECGASFKNMIYLSHHKKIHVTTKDFGCSQCPQFFKTKGYLQTHVKNCHPTEELHCQICGTTYKNLIIFKSHIKMHQVGKAECEVCGRAYASENNLRLHRKNAHGLTAKNEKYIEVMVEAD